MRRVRLAELDNDDSRLAELAIESGLLRESMVALARDLTAARTKAAEHFAEILWKLTLHKNTAVCCVLASRCGYCFQMCTSREKSALRQGIWYTYCSSTCFA